MIVSFLVALLTPEAPYEAPYLAKTPPVNAEAGKHPRYQDCIRLVARDLEIGRIAAQQWTDEGGGALAEHCLAIADIAAGFPKLGAARLAQISDRKDAGDNNARARVLAQAALAWLDGHETEYAKEAINSAVQYAPELGEIYVVAARVFEAAEEWENAAASVTKAADEKLATADTFLIRARAHRALGKDYAAAEDVVTALSIDPFNLDALVMRGELKQAGIEIEAY